MNEALPLFPPLWSFGVVFFLRGGILGLCLGFFFFSLAWHWSFPASPAFRPGPQSLSLSARIPQTREGRGEKASQRVGLCP